ncbi:50S ribosomal protein L18 [[Eubacterium] cellulosolvens]
MAKGPTYNLPFRRRREGNTNYTQRKALLASGIPRLIIRITGKHTIAQLTESTPTGDRVVTSANSKELTNKFGWKGGSNNIPASYLTGLLAGKRANSKKMKKAIVDIGLRRISKGSRIFCTLKGAIDSGLDVPHNVEILPEEGRIKGEHIAEYAKQLSSKPDQYKTRFSQYLNKGLKPEDLPEHFEQIKNKILETSKEEK